MENFITYSILQYLQYHLDFNDSITLEEFF